MGTKKSPSWKIKRKGELNLKGNFIKFGKYIYTFNLVHGIVNKYMEIKRYVPIIHLNSNKS